MLKAIEIYKGKIKSYYENLLVDGAIKYLPFMIEVRDDSIKSMNKITELISNLEYIVNLDESRKLKLTESYKYEYTILELVLLLKTIDWENETLIFFGW